MFDGRLNMRCAAIGPCRPGEPSRHVVFPLHGVFPPALGGARLGTYVYMPKEIDDAGRLVNHDGATAYLLDYWARQGVDYYGRA